MTPTSLVGITLIWYGTPMRIHRLPLITLLTLTTLTLQTPDLSAQTILQFQQPQRIRVVERSNLTRRDDGRYVGLLTREVSGHLTQSERDPALYGGRFFLFERLRRDMQAVARPVDQSVETELLIQPSTLFSNLPDYPSYYGIPFLPEHSVTTGANWEAWGAIRIQPDRNEEALILPVLIRYLYRGLEEWEGQPAHRIEAQFATRYPLRQSDDTDVPPVIYSGSIQQVTGRHLMTILIPTSPDQSLFVRDEIEQEYRFTSGHRSNYRGHVLLFLNGLATESRTRIAQSIGDELAASETDDIQVEETDTGVRLTLQALRFLADQAVLLAEERPRLDRVAQALQGIEGARFLIVGHTADVGTVASQQLLSEARARVIAEELVARGVDPNRLDLEGRAGREPVATNTTETGRALNRRVEIYILEQ